MFCIMEAHEEERALAQWLSSLTTLTGTEDAARHWRERRYRFAYRLGDALVGATDTGEAVSGPVVYGVWLNWGLLYVGQTTDASRRLRDLPVGESHHIANTFPPETWNRVVVIAWPALDEADDLLAQLDRKTIGYALEYRLQVRLNPLVNSSRRTSGGGWRTVDWLRSMSRGAQSAGAIGPLAEHVDLLWDQAASHETGDAPLGGPIRCIRPKELLPDAYGFHVSDS
jgi:hypothetical protein